MQILMDLVEQLQDFCSEGTDLHQFDSIVQRIDARTRIILNTLQFDPSAVPHIELFPKSEDERLKSIQEVKSLTHSFPEAALPYLVNAYCRSIHGIVKNDLLAFATDFSAGITFRFNVSFSSFALNFSSLHQETELKRIQARLDVMRNDGYVIEQDKREKYILKDCDTNRNLLRAYCLKIFGSEPCRISAHGGFIDKLSMVMQYEKYIPVLEKPDEPQVKSTHLTADNVIRLKKAILDVKFALSTYATMSECGNGNLLLSCLRGHIYEIENVTGVHSDIWDERENEVVEIRKKNMQIRTIEEEMQSTSIEILVPKMRSLIEKMSDNMDKLACKMGLYLDKFVLQEYGQISIKLLPDCMICGPSEITLDGKVMEDAGEFCVYSTKENLEKILKTVQTVAPSAEIESYEVKPYHGYECLQRIHIKTSDSLDMLRILQMKT